MRKYRHPILSSGLIQGLDGVGRHHQHREFDEQMAIAESEPAVAQLHIRLVEAHLIGQSEEQIRNLPFGRRTELLKALISALRDPDARLAERCGVVATRVTPDSKRSFSAAIASSMVRAPSSTPGTK
jgi:hypothetical protein